MNAKDKKSKLKNGDERQALLDRAYERVVGARIDKFSKKKEITGRLMVSFEWRTSHIIVRNIFC